MYFPHLDGDVLSYTDKKIISPYKEAEAQYCFEYIFIFLLGFLLLFLKQQLIWLCFQTQMFTTKNKCSLSLHIPHYHIPTL